MPDPTCDDILAAQARAEAATPGHHETRIEGTPIVLCGMDPTAKDVMDRALEEWAKHRHELQKAMGCDVEEPVYSFAYWLFRWSGLIDAAARTDVPALCVLALRQMDEIEALTFGPFSKRGADRLADEVAALVTRGKLQTRTPVTDALEDYREGHPRTERSDRLAKFDALTADMAAARETIELVEALADSLDDEARKFGRASYIEEADRTRFVARQLRAALRGEGAKDARS